MSASLESLMTRTVSRADGPSSLHQYAMFLAIGAGAALGYIVVSSILTAATDGPPDWVVSAVCYAGFILPVYLLHRRFTFASDVGHRQALPRYAAVQGMALLLATLFGYVFHGTMGLPSLPAAMLVVALTSGVNYLVLKGWAFAVAPRFERAPA